MGFRVQGPFEGSIRQGLGTRVQGLGEGSIKTGSGFRVQGPFESFKVGVGLYKLVVDAFWRVLQIQMFLSRFYGDD